MTLAATRRQDKRRRWKWLVVKSTPAPFAAIDRGTPINLKIDEQEETEETESIPSVASVVSC